MIATSLGIRNDTLINGLGMPLGMPYFQIQVGFVKIVWGNLGWILEYVYNTFWYLRLGVGLKILGGPKSPKSNGGDEHPEIWQPF